MDEAFPRIGRFTWFRAWRMCGEDTKNSKKMVTALKRYNGGRVLVFVMGAFAEMSEDT